MKMTTLRVFAIGLAMLWLGMLQTATAFAGVATLQAIYINGQSASEVQGVTVSLQGQRSTPVLRIGQAFESGTRIQTPAAVMLELLTSNDAVLRVSPNSDLRMAVSANGEQHAISRGKVWAWLTHKLDFFNITDANGKFQGAAQSTIFSASVGQGGITFATEEGAIRIRQEVPLQVAGNEVKASKRSTVTVPKTTTLAASDAPQSFSFDAFLNDTEDYATFADAVAALEWQIENAGQEEDWDLLVDLYSTLGGMYLDHEEPESAIGFFNEALEINYTSQSVDLDPRLVEDHSLLGYGFLDMDWPILALLNFRQAYDLMYQIDPASPALADILIDQAEAFDALGLPDDKVAVAYQAIEILGQDLEFNIASYEYLENQPDIESQEAAAYYAWEISERLYSLGWAYWYADDEANSDSAFEEAENLEEALLEWESSVEH